MVRLVFRPYTQVRRTICTSVSLRASTRVSPGFTLLRHSSPSFGSQQMCSHSDLSPKIMAGRRCSCPDSHFHFAYKFGTRILAHVYGLLGPCFKTGRTNPCRPTLWREPTERRTLEEEAVPARIPTSSRTTTQRKLSPTLCSQPPATNDSWTPKDPRHRGFGRALTRVGKHRRMRAQL